MNRHWPTTQDETSKVVLCRKAILCIESAIAVLERNGRIETALADLKQAVVHIVTAMASPD